MAGEPERVRLLRVILSLILPVMFGHTSACRSLVLTFSAAIYFAKKRSALCFAVLCHSPWSWATVVHWSALIPKALRSSRKHLLHYLSWSPTQPAPPTSSPDVTQFGSLVSIVRATNPANKIFLLRVFASVLSRPALTSVSR